MKDLAFKRNPANGRMGFLKTDDNDVAFDETEQHAVMASLVVARGRWWADTQGTFGSKITSVRSINGSTKSDVEAYARQALEWLVKAGRITLERVRVDLPDGGQRGRITVQVYWRVRGGPEQNARVYF